VPLAALKIAGFKWEKIGDKNFATKKEGER